jgi:hypothetical protein
MAAKPGRAQYPTPIQIEAKLAIDPVAGAKTPRLALTKREAAAALGMSVDSFERHVQPELRIVRRGKLRLFALSEIERWLRENGSKTIEPL